MDRPRLQIFGVRHRHPHLVEAVSDFVDDETDAVVFERHGLSAAPRALVEAFLKNPVVTVFYALFVVVRRLTTYLRNRSGKTAQEIAAEQAAAANGMHLLEADNPMVQVVRNQGWSWFLLSWLFFIVIVSSIVSPLEEVTIFGAVLNAFVLGIIMSYAFIRTSTAERNQLLLRSVLGEADRSETDSICLLVDASRVSQLLALTGLLDLPVEVSRPDSFRNRIRNRFQSA